MQDDNIVLLKPEGVKINVNREKLSFEDLDYVDTMSETQSDIEPHTDRESTADEDEEEEEDEKISGGAISELTNVVAARVARYCFAEDKYWFVIEALMEDGRTCELSRYYEDFYDFQIGLLAAFPVEAGHVETQDRTLPYMPGPVKYVTDAITEGRLHSLDAYVKALLNLPPHITKCSLVRQFFAPRQGDYGIDWDRLG